MQGGIIGPQSGADPAKRLGADYQAPYIPEMAIVTTSYRPKRAPRRKRKQPAIANRIVTPPKLKPIKGPVIRLGPQIPQRVEFAPPAEPQSKRSAIVEPKRKPQTSVFGNAPDLTAEEHQRRGYAAAALWRELVRRAALPDGE